MRTGISFTVSTVDRKRLEAIICGRNTPQKHIWRARIVLMSADGVGTHRIMAATIARQGMFTCPRVGTQPGLPMKKGRFTSTHGFGTCRMGDAAATSVTDRRGRAHDIPNLYLADASVFPSSGGGEAPSLTIQALAVRLADHLMARGK